MGLCSLIKFGLFRACRDQRLAQFVITPRLKRNCTLLRAQAAKMGLIGEIRQSLICIPNGLCGAVDLRDGGLEQFENLAGLRRSRPIWQVVRNLRKRPVPVPLRLRDS